MKTRPRDAFEICLEIYKAARELVDERLPTTQLEASSKFLWRPDLHPRLVDYVSDFALAGERALAPHEPKPQLISAAARKSKLLANFHPRPPRASRLVFFRMHYLGSSDYHAARRLLGLSEVNCADWVDEIRDLVGRELLRKRIFPPGRYFKEVGMKRRGCRLDAKRN